jgi:putative ABC transport system permease protein
MGKNIKSGQPGLKSGIHHGMNWRRKIAFLFRARFRQERLDGEMDAEISSHIEMQTEANIVAGMQPDEARTAALREFGRMEALKETCREQRGGKWLEELAQDLHFGWRMLVKNKAFSAVIILTVGLGLGTNTAIFSIANALLLRPLPYPEPDRLVHIEKEWQPPWASQSERSSMFDPVELLAMRDHNKSLKQLAIYEYRGVNLTGGNGPERVSSGRVSASFFPLFEAPLAIGRWFLPEEDRDGAPLVTVLSHKFWFRRFGGDTNILGQTISLDSRSYTVVGVLGSSFAFTEDYSLYVPIALRPNRNDQPIALPDAIGLLKPGVSLAQAQSDLDVRYKGAANPKDKGRIMLTDLRQHIVGHIRSSVILYMAGASFVLLIACANVVNLLLARAAHRKKEVAIRVALGAGRFRIIRQFLAESLLLFALGSICGLFLASWTQDSLFSLLPHSPALRAVRIDGWVLGYTLIVAVLTGLIFGLVPALEVCRTTPSMALSEGGHASRADGRSQRRLCRLFVISEITLATVSLIGAMLLAKSFILLRGVDSGFRPDRILSLSIILDPSKYRDTLAGAAYFERVIERIRVLPGVETVGANAALPLTPYSIGISGLEIEGHPPPLGPGALFNVGDVNADYFRAMGIPLKKGRFFADSDRDQAPAVLVVNESFEKYYFPGETALGKRIADDKKPMTIVGVVGDVRQSPDQPPTPQLFRSYLQSGVELMSLAVRTRGDPMKLASAIRSQIHSVDPDQPIDDMLPLEQRLANCLSPRRLTMLLGAGLSSLAVVLASIGIYGLLSFSFAQRTHEIGVRMALGANKSAVLQLILAEGLKLAIAGVMVGLLASCALTRFLSGMIYAISPLDPTAFGLTAILLPTIALFSCYLPAHRATKVDPMLSLKSE